MNNPLRYRNETFYQSGYSLDPESGVETTTLQVVLNRGWMIPYLCCALVGIGLMAQFLPVMLAYLDKAQRPDAKFVGVDQGGRVAAGSTGAGARLDGRWTAPGVWIPTVAAVVLGLVFLGWGMPKRIKVDDLSLDRLAQIPLSYKGRIQPLDSLAQTMLRKSSGLEAARSSEETWFGKRKYPATRWLADLLFDPDAEINYQVFRVDNRQVLDAMKLPYRSGFRYSWDELETGLGVLTEMDSKARQKAKELRDNTDKSVLDLASNVAFARLVSNSLATRPEVAMNWNARLFDAASTQTTVNLPGVIPGQEAGAPWLAPNVARLRVELAALAAEIGSQRSEPLAVRMVQEAVADALLADPDFVQQVMSEGSAMREMGPAERKAFLLQRLATLTIPQLEATIRGSLQLEPEKYLSAVFSGMKSVVGGEELQPLQPAQVEALQAWEAIGQAYRQRDQAKLDQAVDRYTTALQVANADYQLAAGATEAVGIPWNKVRAEFLLNGWSPFYLSTVMYLFATLCAMFGMLALPVPVRRFTWTFLAIAFAIHTVGLVARIYISGRAPVTSIYSSALAISWGMVLSFLLIEWGTKKGVANFMGGLTGFLTLLVAYGLSLSDDTFAVLQAVLDTQFWLWTHVTIIALGYILTLVAGFWAIWMVVGSWSSRTQAAEMKRNADITYGLICAATLLSFVGTVLGGLWADDSWGRFWGWDPKENGAAMIVLWNAAILHARWAGLIRFQGLAAMAIFGNVVTAWSWFAVNELGVGLHSYGFTEGVVTYLTLFWLSQLACICLTLIPPANRGRLTAAAS
jgi:ABC-type transport system involved in cytochrome c biogenesis permease subunit